MKNWIIAALYAGTTLITMDNNMAKAAEIFYDKRADAIAIQGLIDAGDEKSFVAAMYDGVKTTGEAPRIVFLHSDGGDYEAGIRIAKAVHVAQMVAAVAPQRSCVSMCMSIFAAARSRVYSNHAELGVHAIAMYRGSLRSSESVDNQTSQAMTTELARLWRDWGVPANIIGLMVTTPTSDTRYLRTSEIDQNWAEVYVTE